jgi:sugar-specific transcriptional regulator TrmB
MTEAADALVGLGFTQLEAHIYAFLLAEPHSSGYRIAQAINKPVANTYKALHSLQGKGAVVMQEGSSRKVAAVPLTELLAAVSRRFQERKELARRVLSKPSRLNSDSAVYEIRSNDQVFERCTRMLRQSTDVALVTAFPFPLERLRGELQKAAQRGVTVAVTTYQEERIPGVLCIQESKSRDVLSRWPGEWLNVVVDGSEYLLSLMGRDTTILYAVWSRNPYLAWVYHSAVSAAFASTALIKKIADRCSAEELSQAVQQLQRLRAPDAPGYSRLIDFISAGPIERSAKRCKRPQSMPRTQ